MQNVLPYLVNLDVIARQDIMGLEVSCCSYISMHYMAWYYTEGLVLCAPFVLHC